MSNLYEWEAQQARKFEGYGNAGLSVLLLVAAGVIILIALFSRSVVLKSIVAAYVLLP